MGWWWLTHWGRVTHICVSKLTTIGSDNGLSPGRRQVIIWTNDGILLFRTLGTNFSEILSEIHSLSLKEMHLKLSSAKWRLFRLRPQWVKGLDASPGLKDLMLHDCVKCTIERYGIKLAGEYASLFLWTFNCMSLYEYPGINDKLYINIQIIHNIK